LELHGLDSALQGDLAFPMVARGRLVAVLIVGPQKSGDSYAPDEISAIAQVAQSVGNALDVLGTEQGAQSELLVAIRALHQAILERLPEWI
jgi:GAF domain-containing protein